MPDDRNAKILKAVIKRGLSYGDAAKLIGTTRNVVAGVVSRHKFEAKRANSERSANSKRAALYRWSMKTAAERSATASALAAARWK